MAIKSSGGFSAAALRRSGNTGMSRMIFAAEGGDANAQFNLGVVYDNNMDDNHHTGGGNRSEAIRWLLKAARQGLPRAQSKLAELYADGQDAPKNDVHAYAWFKVAAKSATGANRHAAEAGFARLAKRMTEDQIAKAANLAIDWAPKPAEAIAKPGVASKFLQSS
jgi:TPR repeat protein